MRLYHFLPANWALENIREKRIKLSEIDNLNDPFELWCGTHRDAQVRSALKQWKKQLSERYTLLCFSEGWDSPLMWSHYSDRHRGICLGFDVDNSLIQKVTYTSERVALKLPFNEKIANALLFTKFKGWEYEQEWRCWARLEERDSESGKCYREFDDNIFLREIVVGPLCSTNKAEILDALGKRSPRVKLIKARLAFQSFSVCKQQRGLS